MVDHTALLIITNILADYAAKFSFFTVFFHTLHCFIDLREKIKCVYKKKSTPEAFIIRCGL